MLVFQTVPSRLDRLYWSHTLLDLKTMIDLYTAQEMIRSISHYEALFGVAQAIFGNGKSGNSKTISSMSDAEAMVNRINGG